ncbi:DUF2163 domain-containing protein [Tropicimonas sp. IMCC34043]|uniref:DUF2163 domain-containing protein n=1 Tax=Tropicimonas sp. IMCC34043 TaxID=2248760 RepID=UPI000E27D636|nr:DUF2163 domain-containing protein [Tropicimonas sp. IMCC34043]
MSAYADALESGSTTLCRCFRLTRADGAVLGFTDHDADVAFDGITFKAATALDASEAAATLGMSPDELDASGALSADGITEADLAAGIYDAAEVVIYDVDWSNPATRQVLGVYSIGQVERGSLAFRAELRSLAARLDRAEGRIHANLCDARFGDARCMASLSGRQGVASVIAVDGLDIFVTGLSGFASAAFDRGRIEWTAGANAGKVGDIRIARGASGGRVRLSLWHSPPAAVTVGDLATVTFGCGKTADACKAYGNFVNFRGFPHMPGESYMGEYAVTGDAGNTGGSRFG